MHEFSRYSCDNRKQKGIRTIGLKRFDISRFSFYASSVFWIVAISFMFGLYSAEKRNVVYRAVEKLKNTMVTFFGEMSTITKTHPKHFLQLSRDTTSGVTINKLDTNQDDLILLVSFFDKNNEIRLIKRDGTIVSRWPVRFSELIETKEHMQNKPATDWNIDVISADILPDGSIVFVFEYGGLVKLDRCGNKIWSLKRQAHHSFVRAENGGFWVPGRLYVTKRIDATLSPFNPPYYEDTIMKVSDDGEVLLEFSVPELLYDNGLEALLTASGHPYEKNMVWDQEIVHLNRIDELHSSIAKDFPMFEAGDLILSFRTYNLIMVINAETRKIKWWKVGPWLRQHHPVFKAGGTIVLFNNNTYMLALPSDKSPPKSTVSRMSNIMEIDPETEEVKIIFGGKKDQEMLTVIRGAVNLTPTGGLLISEFEGGRVIEVDDSGNVIWEYINRYDEKFVAEVPYARIYPSSYFNVDDWSCE